MKSYTYPTSLSYAERCELRNMNFRSRAWAGIWRVCWFGAVRKRGVQLCMRVRVRVLSCGKCCSFFEGPFLHPELFLCFDLPLSHLHHQKGQQRTSSGKQDLLQPLHCSTSCSVRPLDFRSVQHLKDIHSLTLAQIGPLFTQIPAPSILSGPASRSNTSSLLNRTSSASHFRIFAARNLCPADFGSLLRALDQGSPLAFCAIHLPRHLKGPAVAERRSDFFHNGLALALKAQEARLLLRATRTTTLRSDLQGGW